MEASGEILYGHLYPRFIYSEATKSRKISKSRYTSLNFSAAAYFRHPLTILSLHHQSLHALKYLKIHHRFPSLPISLTGGGGGGCGSGGDPFSPLQPPSQSLFSHLALTLLFSYLCTHTSS